MHSGNSKLWYAVMRATTRRLPRGGYPIMRALAERLRELRDYSLELTFPPQARIHVDLRESVCYPLWKYGEYPHQRGETIFAAAALVPGDTVWDIGANIGYRSLIFSHLVGVDGVVIAVEPSHRARRLLVRTASSLANVRVFEFAIAERDGVVSFEEHLQLDTSCVAEESAGTYQAQAVTLDALAQVTETIPRLIKIDVEGADAAVMRSGSRIIADNHPILQFEALDADHLQGCCAAVRVVGAGMYDVLRLNVDGRLGTRAGIVPTDNYVALTSEHRQQQPLEHLLP